MSRQETNAPESYSTFWDQAPIEVFDNHASSESGHVNAEFLAASEDSPPSQLNVEPIDP